MDIDNIKRGLRAEIKKRENEQYSTFQTNVREMCKDVLAKLEEQEALIKEMEDAASDIGLKWMIWYSKAEDGWESSHKGKWVKAGEPMIKVQPKNYPNDGCHFSFVCETQEEVDFLQENQEAVLDKFVQGNFLNIGHLNIQTYKDYQAFGKASLQRTLEDYEGHACRDFGNLERINAGIIRQEATKNLAYTPLTCANLERLVNDMFLSSYREEPAAKVCDYLESLGCTIAEFRANSSSAYVTANQKGWLKHFGLKRGMGEKHFWTEETCREEALKYKTKGDFREGCPSAYYMAIHKGWMPSFTFLESRKKFRKEK